MIWIHPFLFWCMCVIVVSDIIRANSAIGPSSACHWPVITRWCHQCHKVVSLSSAHHSSWHWPVDKLTMQNTGTMVTAVHGLMSMLTSACGWADDFLLLGKQYATGLPYFSKYWLNSALSLSPHSVWEAMWYRTSLLFLVLGFGDLNIYHPVNHFTEE